MTAKVFQNSTVHYVIELLLKIDEIAVRRSVDRTTTTFPDRAQCPKVEKERRILSINYAKT